MEYNIYKLNNLYLNGDLFLIAIIGYTLIGRGIYLTSFIFGCIIMTGIFMLSTRLMGEEHSSIHDDICRKMRNYESDYDIYGFPSIHAARVFYAVGFMYMIRDNVDKTFISSLFIAGVTMFVNTKYQCNTSRQLIVGSVIGLIVSYLSFTIANILILTNKSVDDI
jgi:membrane-associated phospholipid phosphatase